MRQLGLVRRQHVDLLAAVNGVPQVQSRAQLQIARLKAAFEQQDRPAPAQGAHTLGLGQVEQGKAVGGAQGLKHPLDAMTVGVGLDHRPDLGITGEVTHARQVVAQVRSVDGGQNGAGHEVRSGQTGENKSPWGVQRDARALSRPDCDQGQQRILAPAPML